MAEQAEMFVLPFYIRWEMTPASAGGEQQACISGGIQSPIWYSLRRIAEAFWPEYRKLSGDARQWKERMELTLEQLPEIKGE